MNDYILEREKERLEEAKKQFEAFKKEYLKPQYQDARYLKIEDHRCSDEYCYEGLDIIIDLLTGEVRPLDDGDMLKKCVLKKARDDEEEELPFSEELLKKNAQGNYYVHRKVVQEANYTLLDENEKELEKITGEYVLDGLDPMNAGYGDYIIFGIYKKDKEDAKSAWLIEDFYNVPLLLNFCKDEYEDWRTTASVMRSQAFSRYTNYEKTKNIYREICFLKKRVEKKSLKD